MGSQKAALLAGGLALCVFGAWLDRAGRRAASWPTTDGTVVYSEVVELPSSLDDRRRIGETRPQEAEVHHSYRVGGRAYRGKGISMSTGLIPYWEDMLARRIRDRYAVGGKVTVYYDPADPRLAVLEPGASIESRVALLAGAVLVGAAVVLALRSR